MAREIADSDAESEDLVDQSNEPLRLLPDESQPASLRSALSLSNINFEDFIDPTQRLSGLSPSQNHLLSREIENTEKISRDYVHAREDPRLSSSNGNMHNSGSGIVDRTNDTIPSPSRKRGQSAVLAVSMPPHEPSTKAKRPKTYSTKSTKPGAQPTDLFADSPLSSEQRASNTTHRQDADYSMEPPSEPLNPKSAPRERDRPRRVISLLQQSVPDTNAHFSTSTSSMGGYQSINLDFRGSGQGLDINANPFGAFSQISAVEGLQSPDMAHDMAVYGNTEQPTLFSDVNPVSLTEGISKETMTSPEHGFQEADSATGIVNPSLLMLNPTSDASPVLAGSSKRRKTDVESHRTSASPAPLGSRRAASVSAESIANLTDVHHPKKRDRKPKSSKLAASSPAPEAELINDYHAMDPPAPPNRRSRRGTLDSSSQVSASPDPVGNTKRKRRQTKVEEAQDQSSPLKHPWSELHLSDEAHIGLPKEQYNPRPSRSRSKRTIDFDSPVVTAAEPQVDLDTVAQEQAVEQETPKPAATKVKGKKSKVKRAKTSAAALRKCEPMLSDGDEDVLFLDQKPAAVKIDLPPDLSILKKEVSKPAAQDEEEDEDDVSKPNRREPKAISIEIPAVNVVQKEHNSEPGKAEPKKRGRKPKKSTPPAPTPEALSDAEAEGKDRSADAGAEADHRDALTDKNLNTPPRRPANTQPVEHQPNDQENTSLTKLPEPPQTHSPLKSSPALVKSRYRIGLSNRHSIPSLLRRVDKTKKAPTKVSTTVKERKVKASDLAGAGDGDGEGADDEGDGTGRATLGLRDRNGDLIEWEF